MRMSRSPQNGGFHRCTGGGPLGAALPIAPVIASSATAASPVPGSCPSFAIVSRNNQLRPPGNSRDRDPNPAYPPRSRKRRNRREGRKFKDFPILAAQAAPGG